MRKQNGYLKVIFAPTAILAAVGAVLSLLGNSWLILRTVVGCGAAIRVLLLLGVERMRSNDLQFKLAELGHDATENIARAQTHSQQLAEPIKIAGHVRWVTERVGVCCSTRPDKSDENGFASVSIDGICRVAEFNNLKAAVLDCACELRGADRQLAIYHGDETRLVLVHKSNWTRNSYPRVHVADQPNSSHEGNASPLFNVLKFAPGFYASDVKNPQEGERALIGIVP